MAPNNKEYYQGKRGTTIPGKPLGCASQNEIAGERRGRKRNPWSFFPSSFQMWVGYLDSCRVNPDRFQEIVIGESTIFIDMNR